MPKINLGKVVGEKGKPFTYEDFTQEQLDGLTPKILKGDVTTLDPDQNATVNIRKEGANNYIDFGIPRGKNGAEIKSISSENVTMTDGENLENTAATLKNNIDELTTPTFTDTVSIYTTLNDANDAAETAGNAIKSKVDIFTTLSNMKQSFSAIIQGLKILATNVGAINGITSDINSESDSIAASSKMVHDLNSNLSLYARTNVSNDGTNCTDNKYWWVERTGKQVNMFGRVYLQSLESSTWYTIGQLPNGYKPNVTHSYCLFSIFNGAIVDCSIGHSGEISVRLNANNQTLKSAWYPFSLMSWITNDNFPE